jgi:hypothetical protein
MERLSPPANGLTGAIDETYLSALQTVRNMVFRMFLCLLLIRSLITSLTRALSPSLIVGRRCVAATW